MRGAIERGYDGVRLFLVLDFRLTDLDRVLLLDGMNLSAKRIAGAAYPTGVDSMKVKKKHSNASKGVVLYYINIYVLYDAGSQKLLRSY